MFPTCAKEPPKETRNKTSSAGVLFFLRGAAARSTSLFGSLIGPVRELGEFYICIYVYMYALVISSIKHEYTHVCMQMRLHMGGGGGGGGGGGEGGQH